MGREGGKGNSKSSTFPHFQKQIFNHKKVQKDL